MRLRSLFTGGLLASAVALAGQQAPAQYSGNQYAGSQYPGNPYQAAPTQAAQPQVAQRPTAAQPASPYNPYAATPPSYAAQQPYAPAQQPPAAPRQAYPSQGQFAPQQTFNQAAQTKPQTQGAYTASASPKNAAPNYAAPNYTAPNYTAPSYSANGYQGQAGFVPPAAAGPYARTAQTPAPDQQLPHPPESLGQVDEGQSAPSAMNPPADYGQAASVPASASYPTANGAGDCGCSGATGATNWQGYMPAAATGCATGDCGQSGACGCYAGGDSCTVGNCGYYAGNDCCSAGPQRQWFFGLYGLYMGRDNPGKVRTLVGVPDGGALALPYYPDPNVATTWDSNIADVGFTGGAEIRLGSTFGCASDPCSCCNYQPFAWEIGYWALAEDSSYGQVVNEEGYAGPARLYGAINYAGLEYDRGGAGGWRPVNDYYDYQMPIENAAPDDMRVLAVRVTQSFEMQNLELNFWRFGAPSGYGQATLFGDNACGVNACGCESTNACCAPAPRSRFSMSGLAGVRYVKIDESFRNAVFFSDGTDVDFYPGSMPRSGVGDDQVLFHDIAVTNDLLGFQLGCNMNCQVACKWALFCDTNFGIYGNDINAVQRVYNPGGGGVQFVGSGDDATVQSSKQDVAFLGEARAGVGYQLSPCCRLTGAYRAIAISGVALAPSQISTPVNAEAWQCVKSNDSIVIHGFQGGVEWKY